MTKINDFFGGLNKSTKITLLSCSCFILMTLLILVFFIMFPITPSEKIISNIGRENIFRGDNPGGPVTAVPGVVTTVSGGEVSSTKASSTRATVSTVRSSFKIEITSGSGFLWNGRIPTGVMPGDNTTTTPVDDPGSATDPGYPYDPGVGGEDPGYPYVDPNDPGGLVDPDPGTVVDPDPGTVVDPDPGTGVNPDPGTIAPPPDTPSIDPDYGGNDSGAV